MDMMNVNSDCQMSQTTGDEFVDLAVNEKKGKHCTSGKSNRRLRTKVIQVVKRRIGIGNEQSASSHY